MKSKFLLTISFLSLVTIIFSCKKAKIFSDDDRPIVLIEAPVLDTMAYFVGDTIKVKGNITDYSLATTELKIFKIYSGQVLFTKSFDVKGKTLFTFNEQYVIQPNDTGWIHADINAKDENENITLEQKVIWIIQ